MGSSLGIPQGDVHKILIYHKQQIFSHRIEGAVSLKSLPLNIGPDSDLVCPISSFFTNIWRPCRIWRGGAKAAVCKALCFVLCALWSPALCCLQRYMWCYPVFSMRNSACSPRTLECIRIWYLATHHGNYTWRIIALADDNDSILLVIEAQISLNLKSALTDLAL